MFRLKQKQIIFVCLGLFLISEIVFGQDREQYLLSRINGSVTLDGLSDEPAWEGIKPLPVIEHTPDFGNEPSERTEIFVAYDDDFLYVAGRLYDKEPSKIQANSKQRDSGDPSSEWFGIVIDSFNDKENALAFFTTPAGLRWDAAVFNDAQQNPGTSSPPLNFSWNTFWDVAVVCNGEGWFAEMRIPFSSLRFQDNNGKVVMGIISWRLIARKNESVIFPAIPPDWGFWSRFKVSQAREVVFEGIYSNKPLYVAPYVLGGFGHYHELNKEETAYKRFEEFKHEVGLDVKYGLTNNLTLDVTLNTDFAQVEADEQQVNLTRFSLFFPEKRLFFQERSSNFDFKFGGPNRLFYSRRIGLHEGKPVRIYGGARLVGRVGPWDIGAFNMQTAPIEELPAENFGVYRLRRQVFNPHSYIGGIVTTRIGMDGSYNTAYGLDGIYRLFRNDYLTLKWAQTFETEQENNPFSFNPSFLYVNWERRTIKGLGYNSVFSYSGSNFNPGIGFLVRGNYTCFYNQLWYGWFPEEKSQFFHHQTFLDQLLILGNTNGVPETAFFSPGYEFETRSGYMGRIVARLSYENVPEPFSLSDEAEVPEGKYTYYGLKVAFNTPDSKLIYTNVSLDVGSFYDGRRVTLGLSPRWNASPSIELGGSYQFNRVTFPDRDQHFIAHIGGLRVLYMLNTRFSATAFIQYNSAVDAVITNIRLRYNPREGNDLYIVYNEGLNTNRYTGDPILPFTDNRTVMLKYTYTFTL